MMKPADSIDFKPFIALLDCSSIAELPPGNPFLQTWNHFLYFVSENRQFVFDTIAEGYNDCTLRIITRDELLLEGYLTSNPKKKSNVIDYLANGGPSVGKKAVAKGKSVGTSGPTPEELFSELLSGDYTHSHLNDALTSLLSSEYSAYLRAKLLGVEKQRIDMLSPRQPAATNPIASPTKTPGKVDTKAKKGKEAVPQNLLSGLPDEVFTTLKALAQTNSQLKTLFESLSSPSKSPSHIILILDTSLSPLEMVGTLGMLGGTRLAHAPYGGVKYVIPPEILDEKNPELDSLALGQPKTTAMLEPATATEENQQLHNVLTDTPAEMSPPPKQEKEIPDSIVALYQEAKRPPPQPVEVSFPAIWKIVPPPNISPGPEQGKPNAPGKSDAGGLKGDPVKPKDKDKGGKGKGASISTLDMTKQLTQRAECTPVLESLSKTLRAIEAQFMTNSDSLASLDDVSVSPELGAFDVFEQIKISFRPGIDNLPVQSILKSIQKFAECLPKSQMPLSPTPIRSGQGVSAVAPRSISKVSSSFSLNQTSSALLKSLPVYPSLSYSLVRDMYTSRVQFSSEGHFNLKGFVPMSAPQSRPTSSRSLSPNMSSAMSATNDPNAEVMLPALTDELPHTLAYTHPASIYLQLLFLGIGDTLHTVSSFEHWLSQWHKVSTVGTSDSKAKTLEEFLTSSPPSIQQIHSKSLPVGSHSGDILTGTPEALDQFQSELHALPDIIILSNGSDARMSLLEQAKEAGTRYNTLLSALPTTSISVSTILFALVESVAAVTVENGATLPFDDSKYVTPTLPALTPIQDVMATVQSAAGDFAMLPNGEPNAPVGTSAAPQSLILSGRFGSDSDTVQRNSISSYPPNVHPKPHPLFYNEVPKAASLTDMYPLFHPVRGFPGTQRIHAALFAETVGDISSHPVLLPPTVGQRESIRLPTANSLVASATTTGKLTNAFQLVRRYLLNCASALTWYRSLPLQDMHGPSQRRHGRITTPVPNSPLSTALGLQDPILVPLIRTLAVNQYQTPTFPTSASASLFPKNLLYPLDMFTDSHPETAYLPSPGIPVPLADRLMFSTLCPTESTYQRLSTPAKGLGSCTTPPTDDAHTGGISSAHVASPIYPTLASQPTRSQSSYPRLEENRTDASLSSSRPSSSRPSSARPSSADSFTRLSASPYRARPSTTKKKQDWSVRPSSPFRMQSPRSDSPNKAHRRPSLSISPFPGPSPLQTRDVLQAVVDPPAFAHATHTTLYGAAKEIHTLWNRAYQAQQLHLARAARLPINNGRTEVHGDTAHPPGSPGSAQDEKAVRILPPESPSLHGMSGRFATAPSTNNSPPELASISSLPPLPHPPPFESFLHTLSLRTLSSLLHLMDNVTHCEMIRTFQRTEPKAGDIPLVNHWMFLSSPEAAATIAAAGKKYCLPWFWGANTKPFSPESASGTVFAPQPLDALIQLRNEEIELAMCLFTLAQSYAQFHMTARADTNTLLARNGTHVQGFSPLTVTATTDHFSLNKHLVFHTPTPIRRAITTRIPRTDVLTSNSPTIRPSLSDWLASLMSKANISKPHPYTLVPSLLPPEKLPEDVDTTAAPLSPVGTGKAKTPSGRPLSGRPPSGRSATSAANGTIKKGKAAAQTPEEMALAAQELEKQTAMRLAAYPSLPQYIQKSWKTVESHSKLDPSLARVGLLDTLSPVHKYEPKGDLFSPSVEAIVQEHSSSLAAVPTSPSAQGKRSSKVKKTTLESPDVTLTIGSPPSPRFSSESSAVTSVPSLDIRTNNKAPANVASRENMDVLTTTMYPADQTLLLHHSHPIITDSASLAAIGGPIIIQQRQTDGTVMSLRQTRSFYYSLDSPLQPPIPTQFGIALAGIHPNTANSTLPPPTFGASWVFPSRQLPFGLLPTSRLSIAAQRLQKRVRPAQIKSAEESHPPPPVLMTLSYPEYGNSATLTIAGTLILKNHSSSGTASYYMQPPGVAAQAELDAESGEPSMSGTVVGKSVIQQSRRNVDAPAVFPLPSQCPAWPAWLPEIERTVVRGSGTVIRTLRCPWLEVPDYTTLLSPPSIDSTPAEHTLYHILYTCGKVEWVLPKRLAQTFLHNSLPPENKTPPGWMDRVSSLRLFTFHDGSRVVQVALGNTENNSAKEKVLTLPLPPLPCYQTPDLTTGTVISLRYEECPIADPCYTPPPAPARGPPVHTRHARLIQRVLQAQYRVDVEKGRQTRFLQGGMWAGLARDPEAYVPVLEKGRNAIQWGRTVLVEWPKTNPIVPGGTFGTRTLAVHSDNTYIYKEIAPSEVPFSEPNTQRDEIGDPTTGANQLGTILITAKGKGCFQIDIGANQAALRLARGLAPGTSYSSPRTRMTYVAEDGSTLSVDLNPSSTTTIRSRIRFHRPDGSLVAVTATGTVFYVPAVDEKAARTTSLDPTVLHPHFLSGDLMQSTGSGFLPPLEGVVPSSVIMNLLPVLQKPNVETVVSNAKANPPENSSSFPTLLRTRDPDGNLFSVELVKDKQMAGSYKTVPVVQLVGEIGEKTKFNPIPTLYPLTTSSSTSPDASPASLPPLPVLDNVAALPENIPIGLLPYPDAPRPPSVVTLFRDGGGMLLPLPETVQYSGAELLVQAPKFGRSEETAEPEMVANTLMHAQSRIIPDSGDRTQVLPGAGTISASGGIGAHNLEHGLEAQPGSLEDIVGWDTAGFTHGGLSGEYGSDSDGEESAATPCVIAALQYSIQPTDSTLAIQSRYSYFPGNVLDTIVSADPHRATWYRNSILSAYASPTFQPNLSGCGVIDTPTNDQLLIGAYSTTFIQMTSPPPNLGLERTALPSLHPRTRRHLHSARGGGGLTAQDVIVAIPSLLIPRPPPGMVHLPEAPARHLTLRLAYYLPSPTPPSALLNQWLESLLQLRNRSYGRQCLQTDNDARLERQISEEIGMRVLAEKIATGTLLRRKKGRLAPDSNTVPLAHQMLARQRESKRMALIEKKRRERQMQEIKAVIENLAGDKLSDILKTRGDFVPHKVLEEGPMRLSVPDKGSTGTDPSKSESPVLSSTTAVSIALQGSGKDDEKRIRVRNRSDSIHDIGLGGDMNTVTFEVPLDREKIFKSVRKITSEASPTDSSFDLSDTAEVTDAMEALPTNNNEMQVQEENIEEAVTSPVAVPRSVTEERHLWQQFAQVKNRSIMQTKQRKDVQSIEFAFRTSNKESPEAWNGEGMKSSHKPNTYPAQRPPLYPGHLPGDKKNLLSYLPAGTLMEEIYTPLETLTRDCKTQEESQRKLAAYRRGLDLENYSPSDLPNDRGTTFPSGTVAGPSRIPIPKQAAGAKPRELVYDYPGIQHHPVDVPNPSDEQPFPASQTQLSTTTSGIGAGPTRIHVESAESGASKMQWKEGDSIGSHRQSAPSQSTLSTQQHRPYGQRLSNQLPNELSDHSGFVPDNRTTRPSDHRSPEDRDINEGKSVRYNAKEAEPVGYERKEPYGTEILQRNLVEMTPRTPLPTSVPKKDIRSQVPPYPGRQPELHIKQGEDRNPNVFVDAPRDSIPTHSMGAGPSKQNSNVLNETNTSKQEIPMRKSQAPAMQLDTSSTVVDQNVNTHSGGARAADSEPGSTSKVVPSAPPVPLTRLDSAKRSISRPSSAMGDFPIFFHPPIVSFGNVRMGTAAKIKCTLHNHSNGLLRYRIDPEFTVHKPSGTTIRIERPTGPLLR